MQYTTVRSVRYTAFALAASALLYLPVSDIYVVHAQVATSTASGAVATGTPESASSTPVLVVTGAAGAQTESDTTLNTNQIAASSTATTTVENDNTATVTNTAAAGAATGGNAALGGGDAVVATGDSIAVANVLNVVNTNVVNSNGLLQFLNSIFGDGFTFDTPEIAQLFGQGGSGDSGCTLASCDSGAVSVSNSNTATVTNTVIVRSQTGGNTASSTQGSAAVSTGSAYASANLVNLVNTNIVNSRYFLVAANNFGDLSGDITLPGAGFFSRLFSGAGNGPTSLSVNTVNAATVTSSTTAQADTGGNTASSTEGSAAVKTGSAMAGATTVNEINTNAVGGSTFYMLINVFGNWSGAVEGLPPGITWVETPTGIVLRGSAGSLAALAGQSAATSTNIWGSLSVLNKNAATAANDVHVYALTGDNAAQAAGTSTVSTGSAYASANVVNLLNTNIVGQNWLFGIFNIFGNWNGDLAFGHPDLWVGAMAQANNPADPGDAVSYRVTVVNHGDADATHVVVRASFPGNLLSFGAADVQGGAVWDLGTIAPGQTKQVTYEGRVPVDIPPGLSSVLLSATALGEETDANPADNTDTLTLMEKHIVGGGGAWRGPDTPDPHISMTRTESQVNATIPATVDYTVDIKNTGGAAYRTVLTDQLLGPSGKTVYSRSWNLDTIAPGDDIHLTYSIAYGTSTAPGVYTALATLTGREHNIADQYAVDMAAVSASSTMGLMPGGEVLGAQIENPPCGPLLVKYLTVGGKNDPTQVKRLQFFLNHQDGEQLRLNGVYDRATVAAVDRFQEKYAGDILAPWDLSEPSGSVYYTTRQKINELFCGGQTQFPLSAAQSSEILSFRKESSAGPISVRE